jgi:N-acetyl-gamma-glutamyl-phosphate/LysW-gamma-L-alpha-aminoadipyl-6-phosphate reductase
MAPSWRPSVAASRWTRDGDGLACAAGAVELRPEGHAQTYSALTTGLRDYVDKNGFPGVIVGLSGGIDSALTAAVAVDALSAARVRCVRMPSRYSSDHSLSDAAEYERFYGAPHPRPDLLGRFVYGIAELNRDALGTADLVACAGCNATASILALRPLYLEGVVESAVIEVKVGSSEAGNRATEGSHHPERSGAMRSYKPTGHRHMAEIQAVLGGRVHFSATAVEMVRGILATCHVFVQRDLGLDDKALWKIYQQAYASEPFVRIVKERRGIHRYPDPKLLAGTNYCDIGFEADPHANRVVVLSAIDNLMKGAAGQAVQAFNLMHGFQERRGLEFPGLHPG